MPTLRQQLETKLKSLRLNVEGLELEKIEAQRKYEALIQDCSALRSAIDHMELLLWCEAI